MSRYRIPPSLAWLVRKRKVTAGRIALLERNLADEKTKIDAARVAIQVYDNSFSLLIALQSDLNATDRMIRMHEIPIEPEMIKPIRVQTKVRRHPYGAMTRAIYACLAVDPLRWKTTTEIAMFVAKECCPDLTELEFSGYRHDVRHRMEGLLEKGKVERAPNRTGNDESLWRQKVTSEGTKLFTD